MTKIFAALSASLCLMLAGCVTGQAPSLARAAAPLNEQSEAVPLETAMPGPQEPLDTTPITAMETVGASRFE